MKEESTTDFEMKLIMEWGAKFCWNLLKYSLHDIEFLVILSLKIHVLLFKMVNGAQESIVWLIEQWFGVWFPQHPNVFSPDRQTVVGWNHHLARPKKQLNGILACHPTETWLVHGRKNYNVTVSNVAMNYLSCKILTFCRTSVLLASTKWVRLTLPSLYSKQCCQ